MAAVMKVAWWWLTLGITMWFAFDVTATRTVDIVTPLAGKDAAVYRFNLRHALKHVKNVRNVYVICRPSKQMFSLVMQANRQFTSEGQKVILVDESIFPFTFDTIRSYLRKNRPTEGFDRQPFDGNVVVPQICSRSGPKGRGKDWIQACRQPYANETEPTHKIGNAKVERFDRTGWMLQQFIKLGCTEKYIPGIGSSYYVIDADSIFFSDYDPVYDDVANNYMPGDSRDCANPPYFMLLDALNIPVYKLKTLTCAGKASNRHCKPQEYCPIAHGMVYSQNVLASFHEHIESIARDKDGNKVEWWQGILQMMTAWHTSPFSEYIMYFAYALDKFPETVHVYGPDDIGASSEELAPNYYMANGLQLSSRCPLTKFTGADEASQDSKFLSLYCDYDGGKMKDSCEHYKPELHGGKKCPAPKYESFHGFRNNVAPQTITAYEKFDIRYLIAHKSKSVEVVTHSGLVTKTGSDIIGAESDALLLEESEAKKPTHVNEEVREEALEALDAKINQHVHTHKHEDLN